MQCPVCGTAEAFWDAYPSHRIAHRHSFSVGAKTKEWLCPYGTFCFIAYLYICAGVERPALHPARACLGRWAPFPHRRAAGAPLNILFS